MVLRPSVLRYKGRTRKIDSEKMAQINRGMQDAGNEVKAAKFVPKSTFMIGFAVFFVMAAPLVFTSFKT